VIGNSIVSWLWGGFAVGDPTLNRFYALHYLLPFVIAGVVVLHIWALHVVGQNNPTGVEPKTEKDVVAFSCAVWNRIHKGDYVVLIFFGSKSNVHSAIGWSPLRIPHIQHYQKADCNLPK
jgi:ubiquinol-cytochrome c reductase cytochrome b/c1 subunit